MAAAWFTESFEKQNYPQTKKEGGVHPGKHLLQQLSGLASSDNYLFSISDLRALLPNHSPEAFKSVLFRIEADGGLLRLCRGLYLYPAVSFPRGLVLYHAASRLRAHQFNYLSLESVLHDEGLISQVPIQWVTLMSSGRSSIVNCANFGTIEFVHTKKRPADLVDELFYDAQLRLWRASAKLALSDMQQTRRSLDLVSVEGVNGTV